MNRSPLSSLFDPESVAVFGASEREGSVGAMVFSKLISDGFKGPVVPVNPKHKKVGGRTCYASLTEVGEDIDLAVVATPAATVPDIIRQCGEAGTGHAIVLSAGFSETGEPGRKLQEKVAAAAHEAGVRILGPNCVGLSRPGIGLDATFLRSVTPPGHLAVVSQSGALCSAISDWATQNDLGFSALVSLGNAADIGFGDILQFLGDDPGTRSILLYVEGVRHAPSFLSALRSAAHVKPVIVLKAGRHTQSSDAARTHTGALMGNDAVFDAALARAGAVRAHSFGQLFAAAEILAVDRRAAGNRLAVVTNGGGAGVLAADRAGDLEVDLPHPSEKTLKDLNGILPPYWSHGNPIDILGDAPPSAYRQAVADALADPAFDGVLAMLTPQATSDATEAARAVIDAIPRQNRKPVLACWMGAEAVAEGRRLLSKSGVPEFTTPERAVEAFAYLAQHQRNRKLALETPAPIAGERALDTEGARLIIESALADGRSMLSDVEAKAVLRAFGIPINVTLTASGPTEAVIEAETLGFPVVMKINSPDISHKTDVGGVMPGLMNASDVGLAYGDMTARVAQIRPEANIRGVTIERMVHVDDGRELVIGVSRDPVFGPTILFGAGGTMVEVLRDSAVGLPPLNSVIAGRMIDSTRVSRLLGEFRNRPAVDRDMVIDVLLRVSELVCEMPEIIEVDINPLIASADGVVAVDARIAVARPPAADGPYDHLAIQPYPRHLVLHEHLADGTPLTIRPMRPEDAESEVAFVNNLSPEAKRFRFMGAVDKLSREMLVRFTQIDYRREMALVAIVERGPLSGQHGVARYAINPDETSCEFAIVVSDQVQKQGIGTRLMQALIDAARDHGLKRMEGSVLKDNVAMLKLMRDLGFGITNDPEDPGVVLVERDI